MSCNHVWKATGEKVPCLPCGKGASGDWKTWSKVRACEKCGAKVVGEVPKAPQQTVAPQLRFDKIVGNVVDPIPEPDEVLPRDEHWTPADHWTFHTRHAAKKAYAEGLASVLRSDVGTPATAEGSGIIYVGGDGPGGELGLQVLTGLRMLWDVVGYSGPVEWWYDSKTEKIDADQVRGRNVEIRDLQSVSPRARRLGGWPNKSVALLHSRFRYAFRLDADAYLTFDPSALFDLVKATPFVYWTEHAFANWPRVWKPGPQGIPGVQGGQVLFDRVEAWRLIVAAAWIDLHREFYYPEKSHPLHDWHQFGDQVSLQIALAAAKTLGIEIPYEVIGEPRFILNVHEYRYKDNVYVVHRVRDKMHSQGWTPKAGVHMEAEAHKCLEACIYAKRNSRDVFSRIYRDSVWGDRSGPGSDPNAASPWVDVVNRTIEELGGESTSVIDLGCGDGRLATLYRTTQYKGLDIVAVPGWPKTLPRRVHDFWRHRDLIPPADLWIMKDVLHHWPEQMVVEWLEWASESAKCRRLLICTDAIQPNGDIVLGGHRGLDPSKSPLNRFLFTEVARYGNLEKVILEMRFIHADSSDAVAA